MSLKYGKILRSKIYSKLIEGLEDIKLYKNLGSTYLDQSPVK